MTCVPVKHFWARRSEISQLRAPNKRSCVIISEGKIHTAWTLWDSTYTETNDPRCKDPSGEFWIKQLDGTYLKQGA